MLVTRDVYYQKATTKSLISPVPSYCSPSCDQPCVCVVVIVVESLGLPKHHWLYSARSMRMLVTRDVHYITRSVLVLVVTNLVGTLFSSCYCCCTLAVTKTTLAAKFSVLPPGTGYANSLTRSASGLAYGG